MRSVRDRLRSLSPSDNGYLLIATELRDLTDEVGRLLVAINDEVEVHWDVERRFVTTFSPFRTVPFSTQNAYARREAYDGLAIRMMKEVQVVQKEAAKEDGERVRLGFASEPQGLGKYLKKGSQPSVSLTSYIKYSCGTLLIPHFPSAFACSPRKSVSSSPSSPSCPSRLTLIGSNPLSILPHHIFPRLNLEKNSSKPPPTLRGTHSVARRLASGREQGGRSQPFRPAP